MLFLEPLSLLLCPRLLNQRRSKCRRRKLPKVAHLPLAYASSLLSVWLRFAFSEQSSYSRHVKNACHEERRRAPLAPPLNSALFRARRLFRSRFQLDAPRPPWGLKAIRSPVFVVPHLAAHVRRSLLPARLRSSNAHHSSPFHRPLHSLPRATTRQMQSQLCIRAVRTKQNSRAQHPLQCPPHSWLLRKQRAVFWAFGDASDCWHSVRWPTRLYADK